MTSLDTYMLFDELRRRMFVPCQWGLLVVSVTHGYIISLSAMFSFPGLSALRKTYGWVYVFPDRIRTCIGAFSVSWGLITEHCFPFTIRPKI